MLGLIIVAPAFGSTLIVTNTNDSGPGSLRAAIGASASGDTISFNLVLPATITISTALTIDSAADKSLTITGPGASALAISGADSVPVFVIQPLIGGGGRITLTISRLTIEHGSSLFGGGIYNGGTLTLVNCTVAYNTVGTQFGGGIFNTGALTLTRTSVSHNSAGNPGQGFGGGIFNAGTLTLDGGLVDQNTALDGVAGLFPPGEGGGIYNEGGTLSATDTTIFANRSTLGGGIYKNQGELTLINSTITGNSAVDEGGGIANYTGSLTLSNSVVSANSASGTRAVGGGISNYISTLTAESSNISNNRAPNGTGGGIYTEGGATVTLTKTVVSNNSAVFAGGIFNSGPLIVTQSTVSDNSAEAGGGIFNTTESRLGSRSSSLTISASTIANNTASLYSGGGIVSHSVSTTVTSSLTVTNSTIAGNSANIGGGGIATDVMVETNGGPAVSNSTFWGNSAWGHFVTGDSPDAGGAIFGGFLFVKNSVFANSRAGGNCHFVAISLGYNLSDDNSCANRFTQTGDRNNSGSLSVSTGLDPGGLKNNGGPTQTIALQIPSLAMDVIPLHPANSCTDRGEPLKTDQRGVPRPQGIGCDIGAFEYFFSRYQNIAVQTYLIIDDVQALPVAPGTQQGLTAPLRGAVDSINRGDRKPAVNQLGAFINHVTTLTGVGTLTSRQASPLITAAQGVIQELSKTGVIP